MSKISLSAKIIACFVILLLIAIISSVVSVLSMNSSRTSAHTIQVVNMPLNDHALNAFDNLSSMTLSTRVYTAYGNPADLAAARKFYEDAKSEATKAYDIIKGSSTERAKKLQVSFQDVLTGLDAFAVSAESTAVDIAKLDELLKRIKSNGVKIDEMVASLIQDGSSLRVLNNEGDRAIAARILNPLSIVRADSLKATLGVELAVTSRNTAYMADLGPLIEEMHAMLDTITRAADREIDAIVVEINNLIGDNTVVAGEIAEILNHLTTINEERAKLATAIAVNTSDTATESIESTEESMGNLYSSLSRATTMTFIFAILLVLIGVGSVLFININVVRKLKAFVEIMAGFTSGDGDLTKRVPVTTEDEIGQLGGHVNTFVGNIQTIIEQVKNSAENVASGNTELAATMEELSTTFNLQSEQVSSVASNMGVMNDVSQGIVTTVTEGRGIMNEAGDAVDRGSNELSVVMRTMESIKAQTTQLSTTIKNLSESSVQIGEILSVISGIADQTNLLALNAAIEAARAGDAGRGFAVVADEVRKLAEGTQSSTNEIAAIITTLQKDTSIASEEMAKTVDSVDTGMEGITQTGALMNQIVGAASNVSDSLDSINSEVNNQFGMINEISDNTQGLASGIEESVHAINEVAATVSHLQNQAEELTSVVSRFKV